VLPFRDARDPDDEKHVHPLQLDVIERVLTLWSNPGETVFTPFMGVGSEVYTAVRMGRRGIGAELKASYYRQPRSRRRTSSRSSWTMSRR
jgi:DNA modification methylase